MDGQQPRQLGPQRHRIIDNSALGQINGPTSGSNAFPPSQAIRHPNHMQLNGSLVRPPNMTVGGPQPNIALPNQSALQPGTVYLIRSPSGELQLVRLAPQAGPNIAGGVQRPGLLNTSFANVVRFPTPNLPGQQAPHQPVQGASSGQLPPGIPSQVGPPGVVGGHALSSGASGMPSHPGQPMHMRPQSGMMPHGMPPGAPSGPPSGPGPGGGPAGPRPIDDPLKKAQQFFGALLSMSKNQTPSMYPTARDLLQQLVDARINPDMFAQRLQEELKSTPQPILAPLLRSCLAQLRQQLATGEILIDGIQPPPNAALAISDPNLTLNSIMPNLPAPSPTDSHVPRGAPPPTAAESPRPAPAKSGGKGKGAKSAAAAAAAAAAVNANSEQHPAFASVPPLSTHTKPERAPKAPKPPPAEKKAAAKQKRQKEIQETRARLEQEMAKAPPTLGQKESKEHKADEDELNDVAAMGGVNLNEESAKLSSAELVGTQTRSIGDDHTLMAHDSVKRRVLSAVKGYVQDDLPGEVLTIISHAVEARLRNCCERLNIIAEHRSESVRGHQHYKVTQDIRGQMRFMEELDKVEKRKREEEEKETFLKIGKSRNRPEDPEHMKMKQRAKEMQRVEQEELRTKEANEAALAALGSGPRKKPRLEQTTAVVDGSSGGASTSMITSISRSEIRSQPYRPKIKRASLRDVIFMMETNGKLSKSPLLYQLLHQLK
ncbi:transcription initiation factor TFIID subunit 4-like [Paramacrobiotus metropolitanus]|uniref:transcription initiation factor TFIID subunit 4-like n=1 Tax=Paramacrobiotus metropolitanus TaxID=2943436 RepID=UPI0024458E4E|nr:transcription initiation factor TFIID subunit 4-like [Paramacrobiotus metropolitanus]